MIPRGEYIDKIGQRVESSCDYRSGPTDRFLGCEVN